MPVEIKELVIRTVVNSTGHSTDRDESATSNGSDSEAIVQECVHQVLNILASKKER